MELWLCRRGARTKHYFYWLLDTNEMNTHVHLELKALVNWAEAIINHLYRGIFTCNKIGKELNERFLSLKHHNGKKHTFPQNTYNKKCNHPPLSTEQSQRKQWPEMGSAGHEKLVKIISEKTFIADLEHMTDKVNTTLLEIFHAKKVSYPPKSTFFRMEKMVAGAQIAALDHNNNVHRSQVSKFLSIWSVMQRYVS